MIETRGLNTDLRGIDLAKFGMSFAVIAIHAPEYLWPDDRAYPFLIDWFIRLAVPFFFIVSGFLCSRKIESLPDLSSKKEYLQSRSVKLFRIWCLWLLIYLPLALWGIAHSTEPLSHKIVNYFKNVLLTGHSLYAQHLWFLYSLAIITYIWSSFIRNIARLWILLAFFLVFSFSGWLSQNGLIPGNEYFNSLTTWVVGGGPAIIVGALLYCYKEKFDQIGSIFLILLCIMISLTFYNLEFPFWPVFGGMALFMISYRLRPNHQLRYLMIRKESMWIYYLHMYVIMAIMVIIRQFHISTNSTILFIGVCVITWCVSKGIVRLCTLPKFHFLEELIK